MRDPKPFSQSRRFQFPLVDGVICRVDGADLAALRASLTDLVPVTERDRVEQAEGIGGLRSLAAWALLGSQLARRLGIDPSELVVSRSPEGKPLLKSHGETTHFNLSHSEDHVMVAFSPAGPVGADVAQPRRCPSSVVRRFSSHERSLLRGRFGPDRAAAFTRLWTAKEACMKCRGRGSISSVETDLHFSGRWQDIEWRRVEPWPDVVAAVAVRVG